MRQLFVFSVFLLPLALFAGEYSPTRDVTLIHNAVVKISGNCCPNIYLFTKVGHLKEGACVYEQETQPYEYGFCGPEKTFPLDGDKLEEMVGAGYDCGATVATDLTQQSSGIDEYRLTSVQGHYVATSPDNGLIELTIECANPKP